ncbi:porin [Iodobacter ciconiae]|uniref:Porin n=1 Tax=Iodobacter ciconiae TaxID=2496266 RepID=A0A3S8ZT98_9NEIS|nr:porin [Iodobacter ciconiae]AZN36708.1 porin [Iodobacter ciconiae]
MFKRALIVAAVAAACSTPAFADVSINGSAEMDLMFGTNRSTGASSSGGELYEETAIVINIDGSDQLDNGSKLKWRVAQKVATDYRYDTFGGREAWIGYAGGWGELRAGTQFVNSYLNVLDWPYGVNGSGNLLADFGTSPDKWKDSLNYMSPKFGPVSFAAQYKIGDKAGVAGKGDTNTYAYDLTGNVAFANFNIDGGYQLQNDRAFVQMALASGNGPADWADVTEAGNETRLAFLGGRATFGDFNVRALYKRNYVKYGAGTSSLDVGQWLIGGGYNFGKNSINVSYQQIMDAKLAGGVRIANGGRDKLDSGVQQFAGQWGYMLSKNTQFFVQGRYHKYDSKASTHFDGSTPDSGNSARITVGTWTGF